MKINDKQGKALQDAYLNLGKTPKQLQEAINDQEKQHKKVLNDLHKHYPEMNIKNAKHTAKSTGYDGQEYHTYEADIPVHDSVKHLFKNLRAKVQIAHHKDGHHSATLDYHYDHHDGGHNGHSVASHFSDPKDGKHYVRSRADYVTKEA